MALADLSLGRFCRADSFLHRLDSRAKLLSLLFLAAASVLVRELAAFAILFGVLGVAFLLSRVPPAYSLKNLRFFIWLMAIAATLNLLFTEGSTVLRTGPLDISREGIAAAAVALARLVYVILAASLLTLTTDPLDMTEGISRSFLFLRRLGIPVRELGLMSALAVSYLPVLVDEARFISLVQRSRGARLEGRSLAAFRSSIALALPVLLSSLRKAENLSRAMESRCFRTAGERTSYTESRMKRRDWFTVAATAVAAAAALYFNF